MYTQDQILKWLRTRINEQEKIVVVSTDEDGKADCVITHATEFHYVPEGEIIFHLYNEMHFLFTPPRKLVSKSTTRFRPEDIKSVAISQDDTFPSLMWIDLTTYMYSPPFKTQAISSRGDVVPSADPIEETIEQMSETLSIPIHADKKLSSQFRNAFAGLIELHSTKA